MAIKKNGTSAPKSLSKTDFVLSLPSDLPVTDVLTKAKEAGISIAKNYVYLIRSKAKAGARMKGKGARKAPTKKALRTGAKAVASSATSSVETQFAGLVAEIGLVRAEEMLRSVREKFTSIAR